MKKFNMIISMSCHGPKSCTVLKKGYGYACYRNIFFRSPKLTSDVQFLFWLRWASICVAADNLWRLGQKSKLHIPSYLCMYRSPEKITWGHFTNFLWPYPPFSFWVNLFQRAVMTHSVIPAQKSSPEIWPIYQPIIISSNFF